MAIHIALAGNPNCGKTTMFNALTGANQYVGNWPGVTVEKKTGKLKDASGEEVNVTDLPGVYSLSPYTLEEVVTRDFILKENPDVIVDLVDATNIERNLYLTTQLIETGIPVVIALNMCDLLKKNGINIDVKALSKKLGCPIIETSALKKTGLKEVIAEAIKVAKSHAAGTVSAIFESSVEDKVSAVEAELPSSIPDAEKRWYAIKVLENDSKVADQLGLSADNRFSRYTKELEKEFDDDAESVITDQRYVYISLVSDNGLSVIIKLFLQFLGVTGETVVCTKTKLICNLAVILENFDCIPSLLCIRNAGRKLCLDCAYFILYAALENSTHSACCMALCNFDCLCNDFLQTGFLQRGSLDDRAAKFLGQCLYINVNAVLLQKIAHI